MYIQYNPVRARCSACTSQAREKWKMNNATQNKLVFQVAGGRPLILQGRSDNLLSIIWAGSHAWSILTNSGADPSASLSDSLRFLLFSSSAQSLKGNFAKADEILVESRRCMSAQVSSGAFT